MPNKDVMYGIGLMSGTSLDGIDVAYCKHSKTHHQLLKFKTYPYPDNIKQQIMDIASNKPTTIQEVALLNRLLGINYVEAINKFLQDEAIDLANVDFIANHGQTVWHEPKETATTPKYTLQLGDASTISAAFNKTIVYDFRSLDVASGGTGAPLVPIVDYLLFKDQAPIILLNIGGISNLTYLKQDATLDDIVAFDTGPGNMLIDGLANRLFNMPYDEDAKIASKGKVNKELLAYLENDEYYHLPYPKATGREKYNEEYLNQLIAYSNKLKINNYDLLRTVTYFTGYIVKKQIKTFIKDFKGIIACSGGGAHNPLILESLMDDDFIVKTCCDLHVNNDAKEAFAFSILGYLRIQNEISNVKVVTGAKASLSLGSIIPPAIMEDK